MKQNPNAETLSSGSIRFPLMQKHAQSFLWLLATVAVQMLVASQTFLKSMPPTSGFFLFWAKEATNRLVYKDFVFPLTPLGLLTEGWLPNSFSNPVLAEQWLQLLKWALIAAALFWVARLSGLERVSAFLGVSIAGSAYLCSPGNITAGYLETSWLFVILATGFGIKLFRHPGRRRFIFAITFGSSLSLAFLVKQSAIVPMFVCMAVLTMLVLADKSTNLKGKVFVVGLSTLGLVVPVLVFVIWGLALGNLAPAINLIFSPVGKDPGSLLWLTWLIDGFFRQGAFMWVGLLITGSWMLLKHRESVLARVNVYSAKHNFGLVFTGLGLIGITGIDLLGQVQRGKAADLIVVAVFGAMSLAFFASRTSWKFADSKLFYFLVPVSTALFIMLGLKLDVSNPELESWLPKIWLGVNTLGAVAVISICFLALQKIPRSMDNNHQASLWFVAASNLGFVLMNVLSGGLGIETWLVALTIGVGLIVQSWVKSLPNRLSRSVILSSLGILLVPLIAYQAHTPYDWWGLQEERLSSQHISVKNVDSLKDFRLGVTEAQNYDRIATGLEFAQDQVGARAKILAGPNIGGFLASNYKVSLMPLECPIEWWDICPETSSGRDFDYVQKSNPEIVVWNLAPEFVMAGHEAGFRGGKKSAIRSLQEWVLAKVADGTYRQIDAIPWARSDGNQSATWITLIAVRIAK